MRTLLCITVMLCVLASVAGAATVTYSDSIALTTTNWAKSLKLQQFDSSYGTLTSVTIDLYGAMVGTVKFENADLAPQPIKVTQTGSEVFTLPEGASFTVNYAYSGPYATETMVPAFDDVEDFGGVSGYSATVSASDSLTWTSSSASVLGSVTGSDFFYIPVSATGSSFHSGSGNFDALMLMQGEARARVTYEYAQHAVPEAGSVALFLSGICSLAGFNRLRRRNHA